MKGRHAVVWSWACAARVRTARADSGLLLALGQRSQEQRHQPGVGKGEVEQELEDVPVPRGPVRKVAHLVEHPAPQRLGLAEDGLVQRLLAGEVVQEAGL